MKAETTFATTDRSGGQRTSRRMAWLYTGLRRKRVPQVSQAQGRTMRADHPNRKRRPQSPSSIQLTRRPTWSLSWPRAAKTAAELQASSIRTDARRMGKSLTGDPRWGSKFTRKAYCAARSARPPRCRAPRFCTTSPTALAIAVSGVAPSAAALFAISSAQRRGDCAMATVFPVLKAFLHFRLPGSTHRPATFGRSAKVPEHPMQSSLSANRDAAVAPPKRHRPSSRVAPSDQPASPRERSRIKPCPSACPLRAPGPGRQERR